MPTTKIQIKRNKEPTFNISDMTSTYLAKGEPFIDGTTNKLYVGDGVHSLNELTPVGEKIITPELLVTTINSGTSNINGERINVSTLDKVPTAVTSDNANNATHATSSDNTTLAETATTAVTAKGLKADSTEELVTLDMGKLAFSDGTTYNSGMVGTELPTTGQLGQIFFKI